MFSDKKSNVAWRRYEYVDTSKKVHRDEYSCELQFGNLPVDFTICECLGLLKRFAGVIDIKMNLGNRSYNHMNGYAYIMLDDPIGAEEASRQLNGIQIREGINLNVILLRSQRRLVLTNIPMNKSANDIKEYLSSCLKGLKDVKTWEPVSKHLLNNWKLNTGKAFVEFSTHYYAVKALRVIKTPNVQFWGRFLTAQWLDPDYLYKHVTLSGFPHGVSKDSLIHLIQKPSMNGLIDYICFYGILNLRFKTNYQAYLAIKKLDGLEVNGNNLKLQFNIFQK